MEIRKILIPIVAASALVLAGCSEAERQKQREHEARMAAESARQKRLAFEYQAKLAEESRRLRDQQAAETHRRKNILDAETDRLRDEELSALGKLLGIIGGIVALLTVLIYSIRRMGEKHVEERTRRHAQNLKSIEADPHLRPEHRKELFHAAIEAADQGGTPRLGYHGNSGGVS